MFNTRKGNVRRPKKTIARIPANEENILELLRDWGKDQVNS